MLIFLETYFSSPENTFLFKYFELTLYYQNLKTWFKKNLWWFRFLLKICPWDLSYCVLSFSSSLICCNRIRTYSKENRFVDKFGVWVGVPNPERQIVRFIAPKYSPQGRIQSTKFHLIVLREYFCDTKCFLKKWKNSCLPPFHN